MLEVTCQGAPFEIGYQHGYACPKLVKGSIEFTKNLSTTKSNRTWIEIQAVAELFRRTIQCKWPRYYEEMRGLAAGAQCDMLDIVVLNVRTEIAFGLRPSERDGCTNAWAMGPTGSVQGQNWDWLLPQKQNLIRLSIHQESLPSIKMITEAGMIGKIGLNSAGLGVTYNALYMKGTNPNGLPSHLALRMALESRSVDEACSKIESQGGMAASAFIMVGDAHTSRGIEFSSKDIQFEEPNDLQYLVHSNHCTLQHHIEKVDEGDPPPDSIQRLERIHDLLRRGHGGTQAEYLEFFSNIWKDEKGSPTSICRKFKDGQSLGETLFSIVIEHAAKQAEVKVGRPVCPDETFVLEFRDDKHAAAQLE